MLGLLGHLHSHLVARILAWALSMEQHVWMWSVGFRVTQSSHHWLKASHRERSGRHVQKKHHDMMVMHLWHNDLHVTEKGLNLYQKVTALQFTLRSSCVAQSYSSVACMYVTQNNIIIMINQSMIHEFCWHVSARTNWLIIDCGNVRWLTLT